MDFCRNTSSKNAAVWRDIQQCGQALPLNLTEMLLIIKERTPKLEEELKLGEPFSQQTKRFHQAHQAFISMTQLDKAKFADKGTKKFADQLLDEMVETFMKMCEASRWPEVLGNQDKSEKCKQYLRDRIQECVHCQYKHQIYFMEQIQSERTPPVAVVQPTPRYKCYICDTLIAQDQFEIHVLDEHFEDVHPLSPTYNPTYGPTSP